MVEDIERRKRVRAGATVGVQKTEQTQLVRRRSAKACPLAESMVESGGRGYTTLRPMRVPTMFRGWTKLWEEDVVSAFEDRPETGE
uniref:Uncharacterized protein n=1 Tax=Vespula pensylvanica TaxID=30213 RepID=A0A834NWR8_VESPE|nr:hypothetical protein H0235_010270 [Vespula pensylvanica]